MRAMWTARLIPRVMTLEGPGIVFVRDASGGYPYLKFPGGKKNKIDRNWRETLVREVDEETGMTVDPEDVVYVTEYIGNHDWTVLVGAANVGYEQIARLSEPRTDHEVPELVLYTDIPKLSDICEFILRYRDPFVRLPSLAPACA